MYNSLNNEVDLNWLLVISVLYIFRVYVISVYKPVLRSATRAPAKVRQLNNISDVIFYCLVGERSRALALLNAALFVYSLVLRVYV